jgi:hypothetical protein
MRKPKRVKEARHVRLYITMMMTAAWRDLNCYARAGYIEMSSRYGGPGSNNGRIPYSVREMAANLGVSPPTAGKVFKDLKEHGFIIETKRGRYGRRRNYASEWRLSEFGCDVTGQLPTHSYRHWQGPSKSTATTDFLHRVSGAA